MKILGIALGLLISVQAVGADEVPANFIGYEAANQRIRERLLTPGASFDIASILGSPDLAQLLGYFSGGLDGAFLNGVPNGTNVLLWSFTTERISKDLSEVCDGTPGDSWTKALYDDFRTKLQTLCRWPAPEARSPELLTDLWLGLMFYDAPPAELEAWQGALLGGDYDRAKPKDVVADAFFMLMMNPHFLVRK